MTYRERREARAERLRGWAEKREASSDAAARQASEMADRIPFGQPILVGHYSEGRDRRYRARIGRTMDRAVEDHRKAADMARRADGIESQLAGSIYSDDPDAVERLEERISELEAERERIKAHNKAMRRPGACDHPADCDCRSRYPRDCGCTRHPLPAYHLSNLSGNIKRQRDRLEVVKRQRARAESAAAAGGVSVCPNGAGRVSVTFEEKPPRHVLEALKAAGFRWSQGSWWGPAESLPSDVLAGVA